jgi:LTXXQ motif family protein
MKTPLLAAVLIAVAAPALAQSPAEHEQHHPGGTPVTQAQSTAPAQSQTPSAQSGSQMPMGQMMQGRGMMGSMMQGQSRGMMGRFSPEDMSAFMDAHIAALRAGLKLSAEQERLWPPVEGAIRNLANLHLTHMQAMRQTRAMMASDPVGLLRGMADHMSQGADAMRKLADAAAPLYSTLDEGQKRRLQVLVRMGRRGMMGGAMMRGGSVNDDDDESSRDDR